MNILLLFVFVLYSSLAAINVSNLTPSQLALYQSKLKEREAKKKDKSEDDEDLNLSTEIDSLSDSTYLDSTYLDSIDLDSLAEQLALFEEKGLLDTLGYLKKDSILRFSNDIFSQKKASLFAATSNHVTSNYPLKFGDKMLLRIWGGPEEEYYLNIDRSGNVVIPESGQISLNGLTLEQAEKHIKKRLAKTLLGIKLGTTQISLSVRELSSIKIFVLGKALNPSAYVLQGNSSILHALYMAGGPSKIGSIRNIELKRGRKIFKIDLYDYLINGKLNKNHVLQDGDIIFLPRADKLVKIIGAVRNKAIYELKNKESLADLLEFSGGRLPSASISANITRFDSVGLKKIHSVTMSNGNDNTFILQDDDEIELLENVNELENIVSISGAVHFPNRYAFQESMSLSDLIERAGMIKEDAFFERILIHRRELDSSYTLSANSLQAQQKFILKAKDSVHVFYKKDFLIQDSVYIGGAIDSIQTLIFEKGMKVKDVILMAGGFSEKWKKNHVRIERVIAEQRKVEMIDIELNSSFEPLDSDFVLQKGDRIIGIVDPTFYQQELILIAGAVKNPGMHALSEKDETLKEFIDRVVQIEKNIQWSGTRLFRERIALTEEGLDTIVVYPVVIDFIKVLEGGEGSEIPLRSGDRLMLPELSYTVQVLGEVVSPGDVLFNANFEAMDYIKRAGGFTLTGDEDRILLTYANGARINANDANKKPDPGSSIFVNFKKQEEPINWGSVITGTVSTLGAIASIVLTIVIIDDKLK